MSNQYQIFFIVATGLITFFTGLFIGLFVQKKYKQYFTIRQNRGEAIVQKIIASNFKPPKFHLLNNITLPFQDGTTQIDHILVSTKGIFIIETKYYSGWIFANEKSP